MIRFSLSCENAHAFDGWFRSSDDFDTQARRGLIACPACNSTKVSKAIMAPKVKTGRQQEAAARKQLAAMRNEVLGQMRKIRDHVESNCENVGSAFPEEARKMHYGEREAAGIYGEASGEEVKELLDEGVAIAPVPVLPEDVN